MGAKLIKAHWPCSFWDVLCRSQKAQQVTRCPELGDSAHGLSERWVVGLAGGLQLSLCTASLCQDAGKETVTS